jgi:hypothetical protein
MMKQQLCEAQLEEMMASCSVFLGEAKKMESHWQV